MAGDWEVAPLRTLDDFLLKSASFQVPNFKDPDKWANRVLNNLLYYQTNYFLTALLVFLCVGALHPGKMLCGMAAMGVAFSLFYYVTNAKRSAERFKKDHPVISVLITLAASYFLVYMLGSVLVFIFGILLPIIVIFVHASMRLRSMKSKVTNKIELIGFKSTIMGKFLIVLGLEPEGRGGDFKITRWLNKITDKSGSTNTNTLVTKDTPAMLKMQRDIEKWEKRWEKLSAESAPPNQSKSYQRNEKFENKQNELLEKICKGLE